MTRAIGGYFELELRKESEYHRDSIRLNSGRYCLEYILRAKHYKKIYMPFYICEVMLEPIKRLNIEFEFYNLDANLSPIFDQHLENDQAFLYVNYFGIKQTTVELLSKKINNIIIDNSQAFYSPPIQNIDTFYSPRKFFGIPDGAYLYTNKILDYHLKEDTSWNRMSHLLKRIDESAEIGFTDFNINDKLLQNQEILKMSKLTHALLNSIDYQNILKIRNNNFSFMHTSLSQKNKLDISISSCNGPMVYPYYVENGEKLKEKLIQNKIYVATYWTNIQPYIKNNCLENSLIKNLIPIPIDQRLTIIDMKKIANLIG